MSDYNAPEFGLGNGSNAFDWPGTPSTFASKKAVSAAKQAEAVAKANSKINAIALKAASSFNVQIASRDSSDRTNSIKGRL